MAPRSKSALLVAAHLLVLTTIPCWMLVVHGIASGHWTELANQHANDPRADIAAWAAGLALLVMLPAARLLACGEARAWMAAAWGGLTLLAAFASPAWEHDDTPASDPVRLAGIASALLLMGGAASVLRRARRTT